MGESLFRTRSVSLTAQERVASDATDQDFLDFARGLTRHGPSVVLLSGGDHDSARYSIAAWDAFAELQSKEGHVLVRVGGERSAVSSAPLDALDALAGSFRPDFGLAVEPFAGGAVGYAAYDLKNSVERLPQTAVDDHGLPDLWLLWPRRVLVHDRATGALDALTIGYEGDTAPAAQTELRAEPAVGADFRIGAFESNFTHEAYLAAVERVRDYIRNGDVYQVNLSQRFRCAFEGDAFALWEALYGLNPAPFYAFVQAGDHQVLCTSMERFLLRRGASIETRPIKGTRPRGDTPEADAAQRAELAASAKDDAELSMIVDLLRNDLGRVCLPRSVHVAEHRRLEAYQNVHHLVSIVRGELPAGVTCGEILRATFPGGSITGCPKIRVMEIIDELEPHVRHVYTGSIGYLGWHDNFDLNIVIRTALVHRGALHLSVGGGIVYDSDPQSEFEETLHKARTFFEVIERLRRGVAKR